MITVGRKSSEAEHGPRWSLGGRIRCISLAIIALALVASPSATASTTDGGAKNVVIAQATTDDTSVPRSSVQVAPVGGDTVGAENVAIAKSTDCRSCHSYATAVQAVFVTANASTVTPHNAAVASNLECASCSSYAYAWQYVVSTGGPARLSTSGRAAVTQIRQQIAELTASGVGPDEMTTELDALTARFKSVIDQDLIASGGNPHGTTVRKVGAG